MSEITDLQAFLERRFDHIEQRFDDLERRLTAIEDRMTILEHAFVGLAAQIDIRLAKIEGARP